MFKNQTVIMLNAQDKITVIGAGTMGMGIAHVAAIAGHEVYLYDRDPKAIQKALEKIQYFLNRAVEKGRMDDAQAKAVFGKLYAIENLGSISDSKLVVEAIIEDLKIKQDLFQKLEGIVSEDCILASNTSSLSISAIAGGLNKPDRFIGLHFFNPAPLMKLVEVIPAIQTTEAISNSSFHLMENWGKLPVFAKDTPGFIVNRVARPFYSEALRILEENLANELTIDTAMKEIGGFKMGPFQLMDFIGHDVNFKVTESVWKSFYHEPRYKPSFTQKNLVAAGYLGKKSGRGFYDYTSDTPPDQQMEVDRVILQPLFDRIIALLINEACDAAFWGVGTEEAIDTAMQYGVNYPKGLLAWGKEIGWEKIKNTLNELYSIYREERYRPSPYLIKV